MANYTLTRQQTALIGAGRSQVSGEEGDMFYMLWNNVTTSEYNAIRDAYLALEAIVETQEGLGNTIVGTDEDNGHPQIGGSPSRPRPKQT